MLNVEKFVRTDPMYSSGVISILFLIHIFLCSPQSVHDLQEWGNTKGLSSSTNFWKYFY